MTKQLWGEARVTIEAQDGAFHSLPRDWTDLEPPDPYLGVGGERSRFRVEDLLLLSKMLTKEGGRSFQPRRFQHNKPQLLSSDRVMRPFR